MEKFKDLPIGIDLGTTFSCIGVYRDSSVEIIPNEKGDRTTPSIVSFIDNNIYVGEETENKQIKNIKNKIYAIKRIIGRNYNDPEVQEDIKNFSYIVEENNNRPQIVINSNGIKKYSPEEISAKILNKLKKSAENFLQQKIKKVVITVPAYFSEKQKEATKNAGKIAGLEVIKIINEPTAASFAYGFGRCHKCQDIEKKLFENIISYHSNIYNTYNSYNQSKYKKDIENILIFDLGGGTLDVSLLELEKDDITVKAHSGKMHLGGEDFDNILLKFCIEQFKKKTKIDLNKEEFIKEKMRLKRHCENAKKYLSYKTETELEIESLAKGKDFYLKITRAQFEDLCKDIFNSCKEPIKEVLDISKVSINNLDEIVLVGGSTRIPKIQSMLKEFFGKEINNKLNPDEAVAYGATIEAAIIMGNYTEDITLLDVCPFSLGVAIDKEQYYDKYGLYMRKIINKGSELPCRKSQIFHPSYDNATNLKIQIYEGEHDFIKDNYPLGTFELLDIPQNKKKEEINIEVSFQLDDDYTLTVTAVIKENNCTNCIVIKNDKGGLTKNEIENAIIRINNESNGDEDLEPAMTIEKNYKNEIKRLFNEINYSINSSDTFLRLKNLKNTIEEFINTFDKCNDNDTYKEKMNYYLNGLFWIYSLMLNNGKIKRKEKEDIISKVKKYLQIFEKSGISFCPSLVEKFSKNKDEIFGEFSIQILGYYFQKGKDFYSQKEKIYAKHILEEALSFNKKHSIEKRVENNNDLYGRLYSIIDNCNELLKQLEAEKKDFLKNSMVNLIEEEEYKDKEDLLSLLDRFKNALKLLEKSQKSCNKLLKAYYYANIIKIEYKFFNSNCYDNLLKMIYTCLDLINFHGNNIHNFDWFKEINEYKMEIEEKLLKMEDNPKEEEISLKKELKPILDKINSNFQEGKIIFFKYILRNHKPNGLEDDMNINDDVELEYNYNSDKKRFLKKLKKLYNPTRYIGQKKEDRIIHLIMEEISIKLNSIK